MNYLKKPMKLQNDELLAKINFINDEAYQLSKLNEESVLEYIRQILTDNTPSYQILPNSEFICDSSFQFEHRKNRLRFEMDTLHDEKSEDVEKNQFIIDLFQNLGIYNYTHYLNLKFHKGNPIISYRYYGDFNEYENNDFGGYTTSEIIYEIFKLTIFSGKLPRIYYYDFKKTPENESQLFPFDIFEFNDGNFMLEGKYAGKKCEEIALIDFKYLIWSNSNAMQRLSPNYINKYLEQSVKNISTLKKNKYLNNIKWQIFCRENYDIIKNQLFKLKKNSEKNQYYLHGITIEKLKNLYQNT